MHVCHHHLLSIHLPGSKHLMSIHHEPRGSLAARSIRLICSHFCPEGVQRHGEERQINKQLACPMISNILEYVRSVERDVLKNFPMLY